MSNDATEASPPHRACAQLMITGLPDGTLHRVILGSGDTHESVVMNPNELGDLFAQLLLAKGVFPRTAGEVLESISSAVPEGDALRTHRFFLVGEDSQIPHSDGVAVPRNLRFLVACGAGTAGADILVSSFHPDQGVVEIMAWDHRGGGFNFYRTMPDSSAWVFAGNSKHALTEPTRGNGPFESHVNGHILMKELRFPWVNWHSPAALVTSSVLTSQGLQNHPWASRSLLEAGGAYTLEDDIVLPAIARWTGARIDALRLGTAAETPRRLLEQVVDTLTVNLISSRTSSIAATSGSTPMVDLPETFFVDAPSMKLVGLQTPPSLAVASTFYSSALQSFEVRLEAQLDDGSIFSQEGDTHFAFVVPERTTEDVETMKQATEAGIFTTRLLACLLMVDFPNPIFSARRAKLLAHIPDSPMSAGPTFSQAVADSIIGSPEGTQAGTLEAEFAELWSIGDQFKDAFDSRLDSYYTALQARLSQQAGIDDYMRLAESRRAKVRTMPIAESPLLFATTNIPAADRRMSADGSVEEA